jgi:hypothetical protein
VRGYASSEAFQKALRKRQIRVEPLFAEGKQWHNLRRFRLRRLWRVNIEALLIGAGLNLQRLLETWGWGRRPCPDGAAMAVEQAASAVLLLLMLAVVVESDHQAGQRTTESNLALVAA